MSDLDHVCLSEIQFSAVTKNGFQDVSILTTGEAKGHGVIVDEKTIEDFVKLSIGKTIPAYLTHAGAIDASGRAADRLGKEVGMFSGFYRDGNKIRANFRFLDAFMRGESKAHETLVEMAQKFSDKLGISPVIAQVRKWVMGDGSEVDATGARPEGAANVLPVMRILGIKSCDFVQTPAANLALFEAQVDGTNQRESDPMKDETILLTAHTAALEAKTAEIAALSAKHAEAVAALEKSAAEKITALEAKHAEEIKAAAEAAEKEKTALNATLASTAAELKTALEYDMRKAGAPQLKIALQSHEASSLPAPAATDQGRWVQYAELTQKDKDAAELFHSKYLSRK